MCVCVSLSERLLAYANQCCTSVSRVIADVTCLEFSVGMEERHHLPVRVETGVVLLTALFLFRHPSLVSTLCIRVILYGLVSFVIPLHYRVLRQYTFIYDVSTYVCVYGFFFHMTQWQKIEAKYYFSLHWSIMRARTVSISLHEILDYKIDVFAFEKSYAILVAMFVRVCM